MPPDSYSSYVDVEASMHSDKSNRIFKTEPK